MFKILIPLGFLCSETYKLRFVTSVDVVISPLSCSALMSWSAPLESLFPPSPQWSVEPDSRTLSGSRVCGPLCDRVWWHLWGCGLLPGLSDSCCWKPDRACWRRVAAAPCCGSRRASASGDLVPMTGFGGRSPLLGFSTEIRSLLK